ncbi:MAG TPA: BON domain-containing protein [Acidobacteriota bacterium]|nr:BON domain-containing protein [Acidobacteriota bacterium]
MNRIRGGLTSSLTFIAVLMTSAVPVGGCAARASFEERLVLEDRRITAEIIRIIEDEKGIIAADLRVETKEGIVVLYGVQSEMESISAVLLRISRVRGVVEVINRIRVIRAEDERSTRNNLHSL